MLSKAFENELIALSNIYPKTSCNKLVFCNDSIDNEPQDDSILYYHFESLGIFSNIETRPHNLGLIHFGSVLDLEGLELFNTHKPSKFIFSRLEVKNYLIDRVIKLIDLECNVDDYTFALSHIDTEKEVSLYGLTGIDEWFTFPLSTWDYNSQMTWYEPRNSKVYISHGIKFRWRLEVEYDKTKDEYLLYPVREIFLNSDWVQPSRGDFKVLRVVTKEQSEEIINSTKNGKDNSVL